MIVPLEWSFRGLSDAEQREAEHLVREHVARLDTLASDIIAVRVAVEHRGQHHKHGNPYYVRVRVTVPNQEIVHAKEPEDQEFLNPLAVVLRQAFEAVERQLLRSERKRHGDVKTHDTPIGFVVRLFREEGYGFLESADGEEIYFNEASVLRGDFARVEVGTQVRWERSPDGEQGPQASTVQIIDKPGHAASNRPR